MHQIAETYQQQGLPSAFHAAAASVFSALTRFKDIVRNSLNTRSGTPRLKSGSATGGLHLAAVVTALVSRMRHRPLRATKAATEKKKVAEVSTEESSSTTRKRTDSIVVDGSDSDSDGDSLEFAEL